MSTSILDKISKVLAQAEGTDNEHEADAFLAHAQRLATTHSIDLALARRHTAKKQARETPIQRTITIGESRAMGNTRLIELFHAVARNNDVTINIAHNSTHVVAFGFPSDVEVVEAIYGHLAYQMVESATKWLRTGEFRGETVWNERTVTWKPANAKTARLSFYDAFIARVHSRMTEARMAAEKQTTPTRSESSTSLVLADKRAEVADFYKENSNARGSWRGSRSASTSTSGRRAGDAAGREARLTATPTLPAGKTALG